MKLKLLSLITTLILSGSSLPAAYIAWVGFHAADDLPTVNAQNAGMTNASDVGYTALLAASGHTVTRFVTVDNIQNNAALIAALNTNDIVIIGRAVPSGHYEVTAETAAWSTGVYVPLISLSGYVNRANRLGFHTGNNIPDSINTYPTPLRLKVNNPAHPVFNGIALDGGNLMVNPYANRVTFTNSSTGVETLQLGISVVTNAIIAGGTVLATVGTAGDAAINGMVIGEFPAGMTTQRGDVLAAKRLVFLSGTRESGIHGDCSGIFDLQTDGATMFVNAVNYMIPPPTAPTIAAQPIGASNLVAGDAWTLSSAKVLGSKPLYYQWYKDGQPVPNGATATLVFPSLIATDAGEYYFIVTNAVAGATSTVARLDFLAFPSTSITNSLISYWPLDSALGSKTADVVSSYDMTMVNMVGTNIVSGGKWGNAFAFENSKQSLLQRVSAVGDAIPIYKHPDFTISMWVNGFPQLDHRVFADSSTTNINTVFDLGTHVNGADGTVDIYIRSDGNVNSLNHGHSAATAFDGNWHNIVYVQRDIGGGAMKAQLWVDGNLDPLVIPPVRPITANTTAIGGWLRASPSSWFTGLIDEVAVWNRALSPEEIGVLQITSITNPPVRIQPLVLNSFKADLPAVVTGGSTTLRWDVSKDATQVTISGIGDVTGQTSVGIGSQVISPVQSTNYVLTVTRGVDILSATTSVAVVTGVAPGWTLLDNFEQTQPGNLAAAGYWNDTSGNAGQVATIYGNRAARTTSTGISYLSLRALSVQELQARTLFFRMMPGTNNAAGVTNIVGLTDKSQRNYADEYVNIGPVLYVAPFTNADYAVETNGWYLGARNGYFGANTSPPPNYPVPTLEAVSVYNVWIDITNAPLAEAASDYFTVYIQKEGGGPRAVLFQDYMSDRDLTFVDPVLGGIAPTLDKLVLMGNSATLSAIFDDFYLSTSGYNDTVPKASGFVIPPGPLSIGWSGNQLQISWSNGTLQSSTNASGPYVDVLGNPTSPYLVTPTGDGIFYRSRQ